MMFSNGSVDKMEEGTPEVTITAGRKSTCKSIRKTKKDLL